MRDDSQQLADALENKLEQILDKFWPEWVRNGNKALLTPKKKAKAKKPTSSFTVDINGSRRGQWYRFSQQVGGGPIGLLYYGYHGTVPSSKDDWARSPWREHP